MQIGISLIILARLLKIISAFILNGIQVLFQRYFLLIFFFFSNKLVLLLNADCRFIFHEQTFCYIVYTVSTRILCYDVCVLSPCYCAREEWRDDIVITCYCNKWVRWSHLGYSLFFAILFCKCHVENSLNWQGMDMIKIALKLTHICFLIFFLICYLQIS